MTSSLIRGGHIVCRVDSRTGARVIVDGALYQRDGVIVEIGKWKGV